MTMISLSPKFRTYVQNIIKNFKGKSYVEQMEFPYLENILKMGTISTERVMFKDGTTYVDDYNLISLWIEWYDTYSEQLLFENKSK